MPTSRVATLIAEAQSLVRRDEFSAALRICERALTIDPTYEPAMVLKAWLMSSPMPEVNDRPGAIAFVRAQLAERPSSWRLRAALAEALIAAGDYGEAAAELREAERLEPGSAALHYSRGLLLGSPGVSMSAGEAEAELGEACRLEPANWEHHRDYAKLLWQSGKLTEAAAEYSRALDCEPPPDAISESQIRGWLQRVLENVPYRGGFTEILRRR